jgi:glycosyltransferase involved in cell wall biosynthesis
MWFNLALPLLRSYPLVVTVHDPRHHVGDRDSQRTPQRLMDFGFRRADRVVVHGEMLKRQVMELFAKRSDKVHVIPHVAIGSAGTGNAAGEDDGRTILFFGRLWEYKGLRYLIEAEPLIREALPDARIVIAGAGEDFEPYRQMMSRPENFIVHNRHISANECDQLFREASIVVLPYIEATQSGVVPLAYSAAKPVVATQVGALAEVVEDGVTGRLVPPRDVRALASAIVDLLRDSETRLAMGTAARRKLDAEWSPEIVGRQALEVYRRAIEDRVGARVTAPRSERLALEVQESHR